jgi:hypothetical protein
MPVRAGMACGHMRSQMYVLPTLVTGNLGIMERWNNVWLIETLGIPIFQHSNIPAYFMPHSYGFPVDRASNAELSFRAFVNMTIL